MSPASKSRLLNSFFCVSLQLLGRRGRLKPSLGTATWRITTGADGPRIDEQRCALTASGVYRGSDLANACVTDTFESEFRQAHRRSLTQISMTSKRDARTSQSYLPVTSRIFPRWAEDSIISCASRAFSSGKVAWIWGFTKPRSRSGQIFSRSAAAIRAFWSTLRARRVEPVRVNRRSMTGRISNLSIIGDCKNPI